jgi:hypothetical protein
MKERAQKELPGGVGYTGPWKIFTAFDNTSTPFRAGATVYYFDGKIDKSVGIIRDSIGHNYGSKALPSFEINRTDNSLNPGKIAYWDTQP